MENGDKKTANKIKKKMSERMKNIIILKKLCMYDEIWAESATRN